MGAAARLRGHIVNNEDALIDFGQRHRAGKPISSSRTKDAVDHLAMRVRANVGRCAGHRSGAHHVLQVRAALLDRRFGQQEIQGAA